MLQYVDLHCMWHANCLCALIFIMKSVLDVCLSILDVCYYGNLSRCFSSFFCHTWLVIHNYWYQATAPAKLSWKVSQECSLWRTVIKTKLNETQINIIQIIKIEKEEPNYSSVRVPLLAEKNTFFLFIFFLI